MRTLYKTLCISLLSFSSAAFAQNNLFYIAADAGIFKADFNNSFFDQTDVIPQNIVQPAEQHGYTGGIAVGYSRIICNRYGLGAELSANIDNHEASFQSGASTAAFSDAVKIKDHFDLTFVPGIKLTDTVSAYLKIGISLALLQDNLTTPMGFTPTIGDYSSNNNSLGFAAGLGLSKALTEHFALFTEANYHDYGTVDFQDFQNFTATYTHSSHVYSYDVVVGAAYTFNT